MTAEECQTFEANPYYQDAIQLRRYDDMAKIPNLSVQPIEFYASFLQENLK
jgi:predicted HD phosphohydrolase